MSKTRMIWNFPAVAAAICLVAACGQKADAPAGEIAEDMIEETAPENLPDPAAELNRELFGQGEAIAEAACVTCHAIDADSDSTHPDAPPFRTLHERFDIEVLAEPLVEGIMVGHPDMPEYQFDAQSAESLIVFIKSLQPDAD